MGTQFFWFYDLLLVAVILGITFKCLKRGFASEVVGLITVVLAFIGAFYFSAVSAEFVYEKLIEPNVNSYIEEQFDELVGDNVFLSLSKVDTSKIKINGKYVTETQAVADSAGKYTLDLSNMDYSETGLSELDLSFFGIDSEALDFSKMSIGKTNITASELQEAELGDIVLSRTLAFTMTNNALYSTLFDISKSLESWIPQISDNFDLTGGNAVATLIRSLIESGNTSITQSVCDDYVRPAVMLPLRALLFILIFGIIALALSAVTRVLRIVNKIPVIGFVNSLAGAVVGLLEAAVAVCLICIAIRILIMITGNTIVFLNTMTIDETIVFKYIYHLDFLNFS